MIIPPPDAAGYFHYTYVVTDTDGCWYGGKRSTKKHPTADPYKGSGNWVRAHPNRERLQRKIVAFYASSKAVFAAEAEMITWAMVIDNPLCMNLWAGGQGSTSEAALHRSAHPEWRENNVAAVRLRSANPDWHVNVKAAAAKRAADPEWQKRHRAFIDRRTLDPKWIENQGAAMLLVFADPQWRENLLAGIAKRSADPAWPAAHASAMAKRSSNAEWKKNQAASVRRVTKTPEWKEAQLAGSRKRAIVFVNLNGKRMSVADACRETGVSYKLVLNRRQNGWPESEWLTPLRKKPTVMASHGPDLHVGANRRASASPVCDRKGLSSSWP